MKLYKFTAVILTLILMIVLLSVPTAAQAATDSDVCIQHTPLIVENHFRYLTEMYIEKYPEMGLRMNYGFPEDWRIMKEHANSITAGCTTDREKADAIVDWVVDNIAYEVNCNAVYSYDTLYDGIGNCLSQAMLMQDLCRSVGIPAVWGDGIKGDMESMTVQDMQNSFEGHAWCFVYVDGQWILYDPVWGVHPYTDKEMIAKDYFLDTVEGITPVYDSNNQPPYRFPESVFAYVDGRFMLYCYGEPAVGLGNSTHLVNMTLNLNATACGENDGNSYVEKPERKEEMIPAEMYTNGWFAYGLDAPEDEKWKFYVISRLYAQENGIRAYDVLLDYDGERHFNGYRMLIPLEDCRIQWGWLTIRSGYAGRVLMPYGYEEMRNDPRVELIWESTDPEVTSVDENGIVTNHKEGTATVYCYIYFNFRWEAPEMALADPTRVEQLLQEGYEWEDGKLVLKERRLQDTFGFRASYEDDISRPTSFGKNNAGQDDSQESIPQEGDNGENNEDYGIYVPSEDFVVDTLDEGDVEAIMNGIGGSQVMHLSAASGHNALAMDKFLWEVAAGSALTVEITIGDVRIVLDQQAVNEVYIQAEDDLLTVEVVQVPVEDLTEKQQAALKGCQADGICYISIRAGEKHIQYLGGTATVTFPCSPMEDGQMDERRVFYVCENGTMEEMETRVEGGNVTFATTHFSVYALITPPATDAATPAALPLMFAAGGAVFVVMIVILLVLSKKRKAK